MKKRIAINWERKIFTLFVLLMFFFGITPKIDATVQSIYFNGNSNRIEYDLSSGKYDVYFNGSKVISEAYALANSDKVYNSTVDYTMRVHSSSSITDKFGMGTKHVITLTGDGLLQMEQIFYVYDNRSYFYTEVLLLGNGSNCYYMSPLTSPDVNIQVNGDNRALFVPFDNDKWIRYNAMALQTANFTCSDVTALYDNTSRSGLIAGSIEHYDWKSGVRVKASGNNTLSDFSVFGGWTSLENTFDKRGHGWVGVGQTSCKSPKIMVGYFADWRIGLEEYGKSNLIAEPRYVFNWAEGTPFGWNSWGAIQKDINLTKAASVVDFFFNYCKSFRNDNTLYIDLDSYWDNLSDADLKTFADYCKSKGFKPGIYWAPFVDWGKSARKVENSSFNYSEIWIKVNGTPSELDGAYAIDPTHPGTHERIKFFVNKFKTAGFQMIKLDFLTHGSLEADSYYDPSVQTGMQAYRKGMEYVIDQLGNQMLVYASISPNIATGRYAHMRRIACDSYKSISETKYTLNSLNYGWWQSSIYNYIDADHVVFGNETLGTNQARLASSVITGTLITGDDYSSSGTWAARAIALLQNNDVLDLAKAGVAFQPVEGNSDDQPGEQFVKTIGNYVYLAVFNFSSASKTYSINLNRIGLNESGTYASVKELFSGSTQNVKGSLAISVGASDASIFRFNKSELISGLNENDDYYKNDLSFSPNPVTNVLHINNSIVLASLKVATINGQLIRCITNINNNKYELDVTGLTRGAYIVTIVDAKGVEKHFKMIKS